MPKPSLQLRLPLFILLFFAICFPAAPALFAQEQTDYVEDINADGKVNITDVIALLLMARDNPADPQVDYNGDGAWSIGDAIALLLNIRGRKLTPRTQEPSVAWRRLGPGGGGGQFTPTISPHDPEIAFVTCDMTGCYRTSDAGQSWEMFNLRTGVSHFEFDPVDPNTVYAASTGLYRSGNGGQSWRLVYPSPDILVREDMVGDHADHRFVTTGDVFYASINKVRVNPADNNRVYIGIPAQWPYDNARLMVSTDRGETWSEITGLSGATVRGIFPGSWHGSPDELTLVTESTFHRIKEADGSVTALSLPVDWIEGAEGGAGENGEIVYIYSSSGIYNTADNGESWEQVRGNLSGSAGISALAVCEGSPEVVYLGVGSYPGDYYGTLKTVNKGEWWTWVYKARYNELLSNNLVNPGWMDEYYGPSWPGNPIDLGICPTDPDICYATDYGRTIKTEDGGLTWEQVYTDKQPDGGYTSRGLEVTASYAVFFDPADSLHLLLPSTDIGFMHSYNGGESWVHGISGIPREWRNTCYWLDFDPEVEGRVWAAWAQAHDLPRNKMFRNGGLKSSYSGGVAVSDNAGATWRQSNSGMYSNSVITHLLIDPDSPADSRTLYACAFQKGVYKSTDGGGRWSLVNSGLGSNLNCWRMARLPDGTLFLLVFRNRLGSTDYDGFLYRSDNQAGSWQVVPLPEGYNSPGDLVYDPEDPQRLYLCCWPWKFEYNFDIRGGVLLSEDGGETWRQIFDESAHVYAAAFDPHDHSTVYLGTFDNSIWRSGDRGETWERVPGFNFKWGYRPCPDPYNPGMLYMTTFGGGVYYGPASGAEPKEDIENTGFFKWK